MTNAEGHGESGTPADDLKAAVQELRVIVEEGFASVATSFVEADKKMRAYMDKTAVETRAHFDLVAEKFRGDVKKIGEGYGHHETVINNHEQRLTQLEQGRLGFEG